MKIFPTTSIKQLDADTIKNEPIASIDLMERASRALARAIAERWEPDTPLTVFAGPGNNGGDALALARPLAGKGYRLEVYLFNTKGTLSPDCETNKERLGRRAGRGLPRSDHPVCTSRADGRPCGDRRPLRQRFEQGSERRFRNRSEVHQCLARHGGVHRYPIGTDG